MLTSCRAARNDQEIDNDEKYSDEEIDIDMHVVIWSAGLIQILSVVQLLAFFWCYYTVFFSDVITLCLGSSSKQAHLVAMLP